MKHLQLNADRSTKDRIACTVLGGTGGGFRDAFRSALETNSALAAFHPEISGGLLTFDATNHQGVGDAFDAVVGIAKGAVEHDQDISRQLVALEQQQKEETLRRFKEANPD